MEEFKTPKSIATSKAAAGWLGVKCHGMNFSSPWAFKSSADVKMEFLSRPHDGRRGKRFELGVGSPDIPAVERLLLRRGFARSWFEEYNFVKCRQKCPPLKR